MGGPAAPLPADLRATEEYQAAWDLEVWKAEEKAKFEKRLEQERIEVGKRLDKELFAREQERADAFERQKQQVAKLSQRVGRTLEALQKREEQVAAREADVNRKKSALVLELEKKTRDAEDRIRRTSEESYFRIEALTAEKKEMDAEMQILRGRIDRLQREHDRVCTEYSDYKKEHLLGGETTQLMVQLNQLKDDKKRLEAERDTFEKQATEAKALAAKHKNQVKKLAADYNKLLTISHSIQMEALEADKTNLRRAQALQEAAALRATNMDIRFAHTQQALHGGFGVGEYAALQPYGASVGGGAVGGGARGVEPAAVAAATAAPLQSSEELKNLLEHAEQVERAAAREAKEAKARRRKKARRQETATDAATPNSHDEGVAMSSDHASSAAAREGEGVGEAPGVTPPGDSDIASLRRVVANRDRLLSTGVMQPDDEYIRQLTDTIAAKCAVLGLAEADVQR